MMSKQLSEMSDRYSNLSRGFSLQDSRRSAEAIPYLKALYDSNHYDEPVIRAYFEAMDGVADCDALLGRYKELSSVTSKFDAIKDPAVFNTLGFTLRNCGALNPIALPLAKSTVELSLQRYPKSDLFRRYPLYNLFTLAFIEGDLARAKNYIEDSATIVEDYPKDIEETKKEVWFPALMKKRPTADKELAVLWNDAMELQKQKFKEGPPGAKPSTK